jgi:hypothetical protein
MHFRETRYIDVHRKIRNMSGTCLFGVTSPLVASSDWRAFAEKGMWQH